MATDAPAPDNAPAVLNASSASVVPAWRNRLQMLDRAQRIKLGGAVVLLVVAIAAAVAFNREPGYRVLFSNLGDKDGGAIVAQLAQMNVPYKYTEGGGAILVPNERVHDVRLKLATMGLPKGSITGFEITESAKFGITQFQERLNFQRGLEGELTRSIQALSSVQSARVHLALPNQNGFFREQQKPSASVLLSLYPGRFLDRAQVAGIVHLVASSVPELLPTAVSVLDDSGKLLSQSPDGIAGDGGRIDAQQVHYVQRLEEQYTKRIMEMLEPVVGKGNVKAQVSAEIDFSQSEQTSEQHRPNLTTDVSAVRSQQVLESSGQPGVPLPTGVPGAVSNQPPQTSTAPMNGANPAPTAGNSQTGGNSAGGVVAKRESITNYEVDKTVRVTRMGGGTGVVKRLTAAVVVNYQTGVDGKGQPAPKAFTPEQMEQMTALVRETIGYSKERGDSVNLMNTPFLADNTVPEPVPLWKQPEVVELAKTFAWPVGMVLFALLVLLGLVRPALRQPKPEEVKTQIMLDELANEALERPALPAPEGPAPEEMRLEEVRRLAKENPIAVAHIVKNWVNGDVSV